jgi:small nuclear ribonucleoprotein G
MSLNFPESTLKILIGKKIIVYMNSNIKLYGILCGFDQFLNIVLKEPVIVHKKKKKNLGISLIRGSFISYIEELETNFI